MASEDEEARVFTVPLRRSHMVPRPGRAPHAVTFLRSFIARHMKADLDEICTDVGIIEKGLLLASGPLDEIRNQTDSQERRFQVRVPPGEHRQALEALKEVTEVTSAGAAGAAGSPGDGDLLVKVDGLGKNAILATLLARDIEVLAFSEERTSLEDIFMNRTRGALQ